MYKEPHRRIPPRGSTPQKLPTSTNGHPIKAVSNRGSGRSIHSIHIGQIVTPTDRILMSGLRKLGDRQRHPPAPAPDLERTERIRYPLARGRYSAIVAFVVILGAVFGIAGLIAAAAPHM